MEFLTNIFLSSPESANQSQFAIQDGDVILLATDGVFDNVPQPLLVAELSKLGGVKDQIFVQQTANSIALMARNLAFDSRYMSPFAQRARDYGIQAVGNRIIQLKFEMTYVKTNFLLTRWQA